MMRFYGYDSSPTVEEDVMKSAAPTKEESNGPETVNGVTTTCVNVRKYPSTSANILEVLTSGEPVEILKEEKGFYNVKTPKGRVGYIVSDFVKKEEK